MTFTPHNANHAVQQTVFAVFFAQSSPVQLTKNHFQPGSKIRATLPGARPFQSLNILIEEGKANQGTAEAGIEFFLAEPDGSAAWSIRIAPSHLIVDCRVYTRWNHVWSMVSEYIEEAIDAIQTASGSPAVIDRLELTVVDRFVAENSSYDLNSLVRKSRHVPDFAFDSGPAWHVHSGWYSEQNPRTLHNLNLDAKPVIDDQEDGQWQLQILHFQRMKIDSGGDLQNVKTTLDNYETMHLANKDVVFDLLTAETSSAINLSKARTS